MPDERMRLVSLTVLGGALHGRRHDPDEVVTEILIGSDPDCHLVVDLPGVSPIHARVWADLDESVVYDTHAPSGLFVNTARVEGQARIGEGDVLWLGPPQQAHSVCVQCLFEPWVEVLPAAYAATDAPAGAPPDETVAGEAPLDVAEAVVLEDEPSAPADDDPFFVGEGPGSSLDPPAPAAAEEAPAAPPPAPPLSPEALVAETIADTAGDDWNIADAVAPAPSGPVDLPPDPPAPVDDFFVAAEPAVQEAAFVEAEPAPPETPPAPRPALDLPPLEPVPASPIGRAPHPPQSAFTASPAPPEPPRAIAPPAPPAPRAAASLVPEAHVEPEPAPEPARPEPRPRPEPGPARRPAPSATPRPPAARRPVSAHAARPARRASSGLPGWVRPVGLGVAGVVVLAGLVLGALRLLGGGVTLSSVEPSRVRVGQRATLAGSGFASDPAGNTVLFDDREAKVLQASPERLEVEVPEAVPESGAEKRVDVVVKRGGHASGAVSVSVFQGPRLHGLSPEAALPGEEVLLAGAGWGVGATVRFGDAPAQVLETQPTQLRVVVPEAAGVPGTEAPVVVTVGGTDSNPAPFVVGHLPVVSGVSPASAAVGDTVTVSGRGFQADPLANDVRVGGAAALVVSAAPDSLVVVLPRTGPGEPARALEVRVPGSENVGQAMLQLAPAADPLELRFVAEPFTAVAGRPHAVIATGLGHAFVVAASGGKTAAARAVEGAQRLNGAVAVLRTTVGLNFEARGLDASPVLALAGKPEALLEVSEEDAAAYNEDWTGLRGRGGPVTRVRLARWWEALGRDLVLLTLRGEKPRFAAALAPEGRVLAQVFDAAQRTGRPGVPRQVVDEARPPLRDALRLLGLRVPASVTAPVAAAAPTTGLPAAAPTPAPARLQLEGTWGGSQVEQGQRQYISVAFKRGGGSISYEGGITLTVPLLTLEQSRRDQVRFSVQMRGGIRHYSGKWDGEAVTGSISTDAAGRNVVASFELRRR
jgi:hypothetical protein